MLASLGWGRGGQGSERGGELAVEASALGVKYPAPFVEVFDHVGDVDTQHSVVGARGGRVGVYDRHFGIVEREPVAVNASGEVDVFGIHEEAFVEEAHFLEGVEAQKHEAAQEVGGVDGLIVVGVSQKVAVDQRARDEWREKAFEYEVEGGGHTPGGELEVTVGIVYFGHSQAHGGVGVEHLGE